LRANRETRAHFLTVRSTAPADVRRDGSPSSM